MPKKKLSKHERKHRRNRRHKPYGLTGTDPYCRTCDIWSQDRVCKKAERQKAKRQIKKELNEESLA